MSKKQYINELKKYIKKLPHDEYERVIEYYEEYFDEAGEEQAASVIDEIGTPKEVADQVIQELATKYTSQPVKSMKGGLKATKIMILWICAAPVALPLIFAAVVLALSLVLVAACLAISVTLVSVCLATIGIMGTVVAVILVFSQAVNAITILGLSLLFMGASIPCMNYSIKFSKFLFTKVMSLFGYFIRRRMKHEVQ